MSAASPKTSPECSVASSAASRSTVRLALYDKVNFVAEITGGEHRFPGFEMLTVHCFLVKEPKLRDIARQEDIENPVRDQAKLTVESRKLRDVNTTP